MKNYIFVRKMYDTIKKKLGERNEKTFKNNTTRAFKNNAFSLSLPLSQYK